MSVSPVFQDGLDGIWNRRCGEAHCQVVEGEVEGEITSMISMITLVSSEKTIPGFRGKSGKR